MVKRSISKLSLCLGLIAGLGMITSPAIVANPAIQGNVIKRINVSEQKEMSLLLLSGTFNPRQLANVVIGQRQGNRLTITIPNALVDPESNVSPQIPVGSDSRLKSLQWQEKLQSDSGTAQFSVELVVEGQTELAAEILQPITSSTLRIKLVNPTAIQQQEAQLEEQKAEAKRKELEEQARRLAQMEKSAQQAEQQKSLSIARQSVDEALQQYHRPSIMQLSIINASGWAKRAYELSVYLGKEKRQYIEESLGIKLDIVNISNAKNDMHEQSAIYFRSNFLKSALFLAAMIPGEQRLIPIDNSRERLGVDIEIYLGKDFK
jgi:hypothetical protein